MWSLIVNHWLMALVAALLLAAGGYFALRPKNDEHVALGLSSPKPSRPKGT